MVEIHGTCADAFAPVQAAFEDNFANSGELGASVAVTVDGEFVVDIWGGDANTAGEPWQRDSIVNVYSTTKTMAAISALVCADRGLLDMDAPVAEYWPEFAANGKEDVLVKHVMSHSAGLSGFDEPIDPTDLYDWDGICARLAAQAPWWEPGTASGYHAVTQGYLQGELVRRVTGRSVGTFFREDIAGPLGADFHIGLQPEHDARVAELVPPAEDTTVLGGAVEDMGIDPNSVAARTFLSVPLTAQEPNTTEWRRAEIPAAGGIGNARSVARVHSMVACGGEVDGVRLLGKETIDAALTPVVSGPDLVLGFPITFGLGFGLRSELIPLGNDRTMWWGGWGGSIAIIDVENRVSIAYVMNKMGSAVLGDSRGGKVVGAAFLSLLAAG